jgi:diguanylate cyclase (GGDEF)-like protein
MQQENANNSKMVEEASGLIEQARSIGIYSPIPEEQAEVDKLLSKALEMSHAAGDRAVEGRSLYYLGHLYKYQQRQAESLDSFQQSERLLELTGTDPSTLAAVRRSLGRVNYNLCDYPEALRYYLAAIDVCERQGIDEGLCDIFLELGNTYREIGMYEESLQVCRRGAEAARKCADQGGEVLATGNAAQALMMLGRVDEAIAVAEEALKLADGGRAIDFYSADVCLGRALVSAGRAAEAIPLYRDADEIAHAELDEQARSAIKLLLGEGLLETGELDEAKLALYAAIDRATPIDMKRDLSRAHLALSRVFKHEGDYASALEHFETYHDLHSQIFSEESDKQVKSIFNRWETEKAQHEAEIYRLKNVELLEVNRALERANALLLDQAEELQAQAEELEAQAEELERLATVDSLTNLYNRRYMHEWFARQFLHAQRHGEDLAVVMLDVDHFKKINDCFGHQIGDCVLQIVGRSINSVCRRTDLAARYGGEEFVVALPLTDHMGAWSLCERIRQTVESYAWADIHPDLAVTVSIGLTADRMVDGYEAMLSAADRQLYLAKNNGRNQVYPKPGGADRQYAA